jgi:hypothetical protein
MNMQDNEFDDLFCSKLGGLEVQPSAQVWDNIAAGLGSPKKKSIIPMLSMAATTLLFIAAGTWFLVDKPVKQGQSQVAQTKVSTHQRQEIAPDSPQSHGLGSVSTVIQTVDHSVKQVRQIANVKHISTVKSTTTHKANVDVPDLAPVQDKPAQVLAAVNTQLVTHPVVPEMQLANSTINNDAPVLKSTTATMPAAVTASRVEKKKKHGIHSLGDLVNAVVSKVDKREDKLIEFTESDDDQSNVTGINLGIIKIKLEK